MTEAEWLACTIPEQCLRYALDKTSARKLRLFTVACCRRIGELIAQTKYGSTALTTAEEMADGPPAGKGASELEHLQALLWNEGFSYIDGFRVERQNNVQHNAAFAAIAGIQEEQSLRRDRPRRDFEFTVADASMHAAWAFAHTQRVGDDDPVREEAVHREFAVHAVILRDIFGNPFRPVTTDPAWLTPTVTTLAQAAYDNRVLPAGTLDNGRLAVLADALEEAGCSDSELLGHLRGPGPHARGCWVLDLVLAKE